MNSLPQEKLMEASRCPQATATHTLCPIATLSSSLFLDTLCGLTWHPSLDQVVSDKQLGLLPDFCCCVVSWWPQKPSIFQSRSYLRSSSTSVHTHDFHTDSQVEASFSLSQIQPTWRKSTPVPNHWLTRERLFGLWSWGTELEDSRGSGNSAG